LATAALGGSLKLKKPQKKKRGVSKAPAAKTRLEDPRALHRRKLQREKSDVAAAITEIAADATLPELESASFVCSLPLHFYDRLEYERVGAPLINANHGRGACCIDETTPEGESKWPGQWRNCEVTSYEPKEGVYVVKYGKVTARVPKVCLCFQEEDRFNFVERFREAHVRRLQAETLIRYNLYVDCMPEDDQIALGDEWVNRILAMALHNPQLYQCPPPTGLLNEITSDYQRTMNLCVFDANMAQTPDLSFLGVSLPAPRIPKPVPMVAVVSSPKYDFEEKFGDFSYATYLTASGAIQAMTVVKSENEKHLSLRAFDMSRKASLTLEQFKGSQASYLKKQIKKIKSEWFSAIESSLRSNLASVYVDEQKKYNVEESNWKRYHASQLKRILIAVNQSTEDSLRFLSEDSLKDFDKFVTDACDHTVTVNGVDDVEIHIMNKKTGEPFSKEEVELRLLSASPALFAVEIAVSEEKHVVNQDEVSESVAAKMEWRKNKKSDEDDDDCPVEIIDPIHGYIFESATQPSSFVDGALYVFDHVLSEIQQIECVEKMLMDRLYWTEDKLVPAVTVEEDWVTTFRDSVEKTVTAAVVPLVEFVDTFKFLTDFLNLDVEEYLADIISKVTAKAAGDDDDDDDDDENPSVSINVALLQATITKHKKDEADVLAKIPVSQRIGSFVVDCSAVRKMVAEKHATIAARLLSNHLESCDQKSLEIAKNFDEIFKKLSVIPMDIEQLTELHEFMKGVNNTLAPLEESIAELVEYFKVLETFRFKTSNEVFTRKYDGVRWPAKIHDQIAITEATIEERKSRYLASMVDEQRSFDSTLQDLEGEVAGFSKYTSIKDVEQVYKLVVDLETKLQKATDDSNLYNSRETLFDVDMTDYDQLTTIKKSFEPYSALWNTAKKWQDNHDDWQHGLFKDLQSEKVETSVDDFNTAINKAVRFFNNAGLEDIAAIATDIKEEVAAFRPNVPLIVALRNAGMRDRHWTSLSEALGFELRPDDTLTLDDVLKMNLQEKLEMISKVSEQAAKEYQIEEQLNKMMGEWKDQMLDIFPYRSASFSPLSLSPLLPIFRT
jgi:dynein heavy chain